MSGAEDVRRTVALGAAVGVAVDAGLCAEVLDPVTGGLDAGLVEWSVNAGDDARGALRFGAWVAGDDPALRGLVTRHGGAALEALREAVPHAGMEGAGWAFGADGAARFRWWQLAGEDDGAALHAGAAGLVGGDVAAVAARCGGAARCRAVGAEVGEDGGLLRATLYYSVLRPAVALGLLSAIGAPDEARGRMLLAGLCGLDGRFGLPWPKVWVGRSVGRAGGGYKLYVFLRGAERRPGDAALIEMAGGGGAAAARAAFGGPACAIPIVGLTWGEGGGAPRWTVYLADR